MKKNFSLRIFNLLAKRVYKLSKKRKLGWKWRDCQKWTSANLFKKYKGTPLSKIKVTNVDKDIIGILDGTAMPTTTAGVPKQVEVCSSVFLLTDNDLSDQPFYYLYDVIFGGNGKIGFDDNLKIAVDIHGFYTGIIKKKELSQRDITDLVSKIRKMNFGSDENGAIIIFKRLQVPDTKDQSNPCNGYILITTIGSNADMSSTEVEKVVSEKDLTKEERAKREQIAKEQEEKRKSFVTKKEIKAQPRPRQVEAKPEDGQKISTERMVAFNEATARLERLLDKKAITRKQFQESFKKLNDNLAKGGII